MTEVSRQDRQEALWILVGPIPPYQRIRCESVPHVMQTWTVMIGYPAQTDLPGQLIERSMNLSAIQTIAPVGNEQIGGDLSSRPMTFASRDVVGKYFARRCVQRHESALAKLGAADGQHRRLKIQSPEARDFALRRDVGRRHSIVRTDNGKSKAAVC